MSFSPPIYRSLLKLLENPNERFMEHDINGLSLISVEEAQPKRTVAISKSIPMPKISMSMSCSNATQTGNSNANRSQSQSPFSLPASTSQTPADDHTAETSSTAVTFPSASPPKTSGHLPSLSQIQKKRPSSNGEKIVDFPVKKLKLQAPGEVSESDHDVTPSLEDYSALIQKVNAMEQSQRSLQEKVSELEAAAEYREQKLKSTTSSLEALQSQSETLMKDCNQKKQENLHLRGAYQSHKKEIGDLQRQLALERTSRSEAEKVVDDIRREMTHPFIVPGLIDAFILFARKSPPEDNLVSPITDSSSSAANITS